MDLKAFNLKLRDQKFLTDKEDIKYWLESKNIKNFTINNDLTVDVNGNVELSNRYRVYNKEHLPIQFGKVTGNFDISNNNLVSLEGSPFEVGGNFNCSNNEDLKSLDYIPSKISGKLSVYSYINSIEDLKVYEIIVDSEYTEYSNTLKSYLENKKLQEKIIAETPKLQETQNIKPVRRMKL